MSEYFLTYLLTSRLLYFGYSYATYPTGIHSKLKAFDCVIFPIHKICSSQFIWEVLWSCLNLETSAFYLNNPAMQDYYRYTYSFESKQIKSRDNADHNSVKHFHDPFIMIYLHLFRNDINVFLWHRAFVPKIVFGI